MPKMFDRTSVRKKRLVEIEIENLFPFENIRDGD